MESRLAEQIVREQDGERERLRTEVLRLHEELEQARVKLEDHDEQLLGMTQECQRLTKELSRRADREREAERLILELRGKLGNTAASLLELEAEQARGATAEEELRVTIEELQVMAEEREEANESLRQLNAELDHRVAERTAELARANLALETTNAELNSRVEAEVAAREEAQAKLFHRQKLEALGQLTGGVAHDFNNLLTVVMSGVHLLGRTDDPERRQQLTERVEQAATRGAELTRRLLAFGRRQNLRPESVDLHARITDWRELLAHSLRPDMEIEVDLAPDVCPIVVDTVALELALLNLAVNARHAMPHGGKVTISAHNRWLGAWAKTELGLRPGNYVSLSVSDTGIGIPPDVLDHVFEPFFTTKDTGKGTGLGLAQVYGFAQQSGGTATVESTPGVGTTFTMLLPCNRTQPEPTSQAGRETEGGEERRAAILVAEDDPDLAAAVVDLLTQFGHEVTTASTAAETLDAVSNTRPLDLLFIDVMLQGGTSGLDLAKEVMRRRSDLPIVLTTGHGGQLLSDAGFSKFPLLRKPYQAAELKAVVQKSLKHRHSAAAAF